MANLLLYRSDGASFIEHRIASDWTIISNKPTNFPPTAHNHDASNINAGTLHADRIPTLPQSKVANLQSTLNIGLDTPIPELDNHTLQEVFENPTHVYNKLYTDTTGDFLDVVDSVVIANNKYYTRIIIDVISGSYQNVRIESRPDGLPSSAYAMTTNIIWTSKSNETHIRNYGISATSFTGSVRIEYYNMNAKGISSLTVEEMNYWFSVYVKLVNDYARPASDVYAWAKAPTKPSYDLSEIAETTTYKRVTQTEKDTWNAKQDALGYTPYNATNPSGYISGITKAMVEAVLTDNITSHYHSAYLTSVPSHTDDVGAYGKATTSLYGHVVIKNDLNTSEYLAGETLSAHQGYQLGLNKVDKNTAITAGTKCKITYDAKGLVTSGDDLADTDIPNISAAKITTGTLPIARGGTGVTSLDSLKASLALTTNSVASSRALALTDAQDMIIANHSSTQISLTVPLNSSVAFPIGTEITIMRTGAAKVNILNASGVTINSVSNYRYIALQYQAVTLKKLNTDEWILFGALAGS